jgi:hypothetical protein
MKAVATLALLAGPLWGHGQELATPPQQEEGLTAAEPAANSMDDSGVFSERPAPGVGVSDADINTTGEADSPERR